MDEDAENKNLAKHQIGMVLDALSVDELQGRIGQLSAEIVRLEQEIEKKAATLSKAEGAFKL